MTHLQDVSCMNLEEIKNALQDTKDKLRRVSHQISYLDEQIAYLRKLFRRAVKNDGYAVRYNLRMQLSISSGVKVMYHHYQATMEARRISLQDRLKLFSDSSSGSETSESVDDHNYC